MFTQVYMLAGIIQILNLIILGNSFTLLHYQVNKVHKMRIQARRFWMLMIQSMRKTIDIYIFIFILFTI
jgi:hypothetical protein